SIAAAKLGWTPVLACDHDPASVAATRAGAAANGVEVDVCRCDLRERPGPFAPTVLANLVTRLLVDLAGRLGPVPDRLLVSGVYVHEAGVVADALAERGLREANRLENGGWASLEFVK